jgi:DNA end-binding protein Ku
MITDKEKEMAVQGIWSGTISFSLVAIPVQLVKAVEPGRVSFHLLHNKDYSPLLRRMYCPREEQVVGPEEIIRGYEVGPDKYILIADEELESISPERSRTIEIIEFIDIKEVDSVYYDHPYYLVPAKGGEKAYQLLVEVMRRTKKAGLAKFILGEREYLVAVQSSREVLTLITLHYSEDILPAEVKVPEARQGESPEMIRMKGIIKKMNADFNPDNYANVRRKKILALLQKKKKKQEPVESPQIEEEEGEGPADLVSVLEQSMQKVKRKR